MLEKVIAHLKVGAQKKTTNCSYFVNVYRRRRVWVCVCDLLVKGPAACIMKFLAYWGIGRLQTAF